MKNKIGRPKIASHEAKGELFAVRVTPPDAKAINAAIRQSGQAKPDWLRTAMLSAAGSDKPSA